MTKPADLHGGLVFLGQRGLGFRASRIPRNAWKEFHQTEIFRADPTRPLTAYFDPSAYGLKVVPKKKPEAA